MMYLAIYLICIIIAIFLFVRFTDRFDAVDAMLAILWPITLVSLLTMRIFDLINVVKKKLKKNDPLYHCRQFKLYGCPFIDTFDCNFNTCSFKNPKLNFSFGRKFKK